MINFDTEGKLFDTVQNVSGIIIMIVSILSADAFPFVFGTNIFQISVY